MFKKIILVVFVLLLCSCNPSELKTVDQLGDPIPWVAPHYDFKFTIENVMERSTHVAIVELLDQQPYDEDGMESIFIFSVKSLLAGKLPSNTIKVLNNSACYKPDETYLLFLSVSSFSEWPYDLHIPFTPYTFRISNGEDIDCLQRIEMPSVNAERTFVKPFENPEHNKLSFLKKYIEKRATSVEKYTLVSENTDLDYLNKEADVILVIHPNKIEYINPFINDVWYEMIDCFQGTPPENNWLMLPTDIYLDNDYLLFLTESEPKVFSLTSRGSYFPKGSPEYTNFMTGLED
ncbi:MAG: hypothetical protein PHW26_07730 [Eubacteriales bacterium]|nr:hypothetical protein [Eubacteriales bacterium]